MTVYEFPKRELRPDEVAEMRAVFTATPLTAEQLMHGPLEEIDQPGPWIAPPDSVLSDELCRLRSIVAGLLGPGRVPLGEGLDACFAIVYRLRQGVKR